MRLIENKETIENKYKIIEIFKKKILLHVYVKRPIQYFFRFDDGFMLRNIRFRFKWCKHNPKGMRLHIQVWLPLLYLVRDNNKWEIGNKYRILIYH